MIKEALQDFMTFLRFQSVSTDPAYHSEIIACSKWVYHYLKEIGFEVEVWETPGHPTIFAEYKAGDDKPTLLTYGHYDVQPVDPIDEWDSPPFEPKVIDGKVYARGTCDNKGQCFYTLLALKMLMKKQGSLPINVKMVIEGDEEVGSYGLSAILEEKKERLKSDYIAIIDLGMDAPNEPAITLGMRGIVTMDVIAKGSRGDLHSGMVGGMVYNPIHALVSIFSKLRDPQTGKVTIPKFYDDVEKISKLEKTHINEATDPIAFLKQFEATPSGGEVELAPWERAWVRPTLEINGISGGYEGEGFKTVIPQEARAKVSCRLVPDQCPEKIGRLVGETLKALAPEGITVTVDIHPGCARATRGSADSKVSQAFSQAYQEIFGVKTRFIYSGGTVGISAELQKVTGGEIVFVGLGLPTDCFHAPNEHFGIDRIEQGCRSVIRAIEILGKN